MPDRELTPEELRALVVEGQVDPSQLHAKLTPNELATLLKLSLSDEKIMDGLGGIKGGPVSPLVGSLGGAAAKGVAEAGKAAVGQRVAQTAPNMERILKQLQGYKGLTGGAKQKAAYMSSRPDAQAALKGGSNNLNRVMARLKGLIDGTVQP